MKKGYVILDKKNKVISLFRTAEDAMRVIRRMFSYREWATAQLSLALALIENGKLVEILAYINVF